MSMIRFSLTVLCPLLPLTALSRAQAQVMLEADGPGNTYELIASKGFGLETPDCKHAVKHVAEEMDPDLGKNVFIFTLHRDLDDDRRINTDRQRVEMKTSYLRDESIRLADFCLAEGAAKCGSFSGNNNGTLATKK